MVGGGEVGILMFLPDPFSILLRMACLQREKDLFALDFPKIGTTSEEDIFLTWFLQMILNPENEEVKTVKLDV